MKFNCVLLHLFNVNFWHCSFLWNNSNCFDDWWIVGACWKTTRTSRFPQRSSEFGGCNQGFFSFILLLYQVVSVCFNFDVFWAISLCSIQIQLKFLAEEMQAISKGLEKVVQELTASENDGPVSDNFCQVWYITGHLKMLQPEWTDSEFWWFWINRYCTSLA